MNLISPPSAGSDGGLLAYEQANTAYLKEVLKNLDGVILTLADVKAKLDELPAQIKEANDISRQLGRYEEIRSALQKFIELNEEDILLPASRRNFNEGGYRDVADKVQAARGVLMLYPSIVSAVALPEALGLEVAARLKGNQTGKVLPALKAYQEWTVNIRNPNVIDSVRWTITYKLLPLHDSQTKECEHLFKNSEECSPKEGQTVSNEFATCFSPFIGLPGTFSEARFNVRIAYVATVRGNVNSDGVIEVIPTEVKRTVTNARDDNCKLIRLLPAPSCTSNCPVDRPDNAGPWATLNPALIDSVVDQEEQTFSGQWSRDQFTSLQQLGASISNVRNEIDIYGKALVIIDRASAEIATRLKQYQ